MTKKIKIDKAQNTRKVLPKDEGCLENKKRACWQEAKERRRGGNPFRKKNKKG